MNNVFLVNLYTSFNIHKITETPGMFRGQDKYGAFVEHNYLKKSVEDGHEHTIWGIDTGDFKDGMRSIAIIQRIPKEISDYILKNENAGYLTSMAYQLKLTNSGYNTPREAYNAAHKMWKSKLDKQGLLKRGVNGLNVDIDEVLNKQTSLDENSGGGYIADDNGLKQDYSKFSKYLKKLGIYWIYEFVPKEDRDATLFFDM